MDYLLALIVFLVIVLGPKPVLSQDKPSIYLNDTLNYRIENKGFFKKLLQQIKFRENRNSTETQRVYEYIQKLIKDGDLSIDASIGELTQLIDTLQFKLSVINAKDSTRMDGIDNELLANKFADSVLRLVIDSLQLDVLELKKTFVLDSLMEIELEPIAAREDILKLRAVNYTCTYLDEKLLAGEVVLLENETHFLRHKKRVIGWHDINDSLARFKNYNYKYLTAIHLSAYELSASGLAKNKGDLQKFTFTNNDVIALAQSNFTDLYLTVHSNSSEELSIFLNEDFSQDRLIDNLKEYVSTIGLKGLNINFEKIKLSDSRAFDRFISRLKNTIKISGLPVTIDITLPAVFDDESLERTQAYNFGFLNGLVDHYIVLTDEMVRLDNNWAVPKSPLFKRDNLTLGTIQGSIDFYANGKIPINKLIMTVSYLGIEWPVVSFEGPRKDEVHANREVSQIQYSHIQEAFLKNKKFNDAIKVGLDTVQASAFLEINEEGYDIGKTKIWYENEHTLQAKYNWLLQNELAGVAIRGLGLDDGHAELWDVLGISFMEVVRSDVDIVKQEVCDTITINGKERKAMLKSIVFGDFFTNFQAHPSGGEQESTLDKINHDYQWSKEVPLLFKTAEFKYEEDPKKNLLNNRETCICILKRWYAYADVCFLLSILLGLIIIYLRIRIYRFRRFRTGISENTNKWYKWASILLPIPAYFLIYAAIFFRPDITAIVDKGVVSSTRFMLWVGVGIFLGVILWRNFTQGGYVRKNLP